MPSSLPDIFYTGNKAGGKFGPAIPVKLIDKSTGHVVTSGPVSCAKLDVVAVDGNFDNEDDDDWTLEDFKSHVVTDRDGKKLLTGNLELSLKEGVGSLGELTFTDNSSWMQGKKIRLGVQVASGICEGIRVREAKSNPFVVKDRRGEGRFLHILSQHSTIHVLSYLFFPYTVNALKTFQLFFWALQISVVIYSLDGD